jgi:hypothetical protein
MMPITDPGFIAPDAYFITPEQPFVIGQFGKPSLVLDVYGANPAPNRQVIAYPPNGGSNQAWRFIPAGTPGWWYLQTTMTTGFVLTLATEQNVVVAPISKDEDQRKNQLWCLMPSEVLGYWFIQSKSVVSNELNAKVIGTSNAAAPTIPDPIAVVVDVDYANYTPLVWSFRPIPVTG